MDEFKIRRYKLTIVTYVDVLDEDTGAISSAADLINVSGLEMGTDVGDGLNPQEFEVVSFEDEGVVDEQ